MVTFSTVGYGDYRPDDWPAQTFVIIMIACALILLPVEVSLLFIFTVDSDVVINCPSSRCTSVQNVPIRSLCR